MSEAYEKKYLFSLVPIMENKVILSKTTKKEGYRGKNAYIYIYNRNNLINYHLHNILIRTIIHLQDLGELDQKTVDKAHSFFE